MPYVNPKYQHELRGAAAADPTPHRYLDGKPVPARVQQSGENGPLGRTYTSIPEPTEES